MRIINDMIYVRILYYSNVMCVLFLYSVFFFYHVSFLKSINSFIECAIKRYYVFAFYEKFLNICNFTLIVKSK